MTKKEIFELVKDANQKLQTNENKLGEDFWKQILTIPEEDRHLLNIECDNDITYFSVDGEEWDDEEVYADYVIISDGVGLLKALGFNASFV